MSTSIHYKYTPMSCYDMIQFMVKHEDSYVACDFKNDSVETFEFLVDAAAESHCEEILERIIVSFYNYKDYDLIQNVYQFKHWAIREYEHNLHNYYELTAFCRENNIPVCMIKKEYLDAGDDISILTEHGITVFVAVVNDLHDLKQYKAKGVSGCVSDYLYEPDLQYIR